MFEEYLTKCGFCGKGTISAKGIYIHECEYFSCPIGFYISKNSVIFYVTRNIDYDTGDWILSMTRKWADIDVSLVNGRRVLGSVTNVINICFDPEEDKFSKIKSAIAASLFL